MNLNLAYELATAVAEHPEFDLEVRGREATREVSLMAEAGLIAGFAHLCGDQSHARITALTAAGWKLLRALRGAPLKSEVIYEMYLGKHRQHA